MPELPDDAAIDTLLSATFAALTPPNMPLALRAQVMQAVEAEAEYTKPQRVSIVEERQANRLMRVTWQTTPSNTKLVASAPLSPLLSPSSPSLKRIERVRTVQVISRKGTP